MQRRWDEQLAAYVQASFRANHLSQKPPGGFLISGQHKGGSGTSTRRAGAGSKAVTMVTSPEVQ